MPPMASLVLMMVAMNNATATKDGMTIAKEEMAIARDEKTDL